MPNFADPVIGCVAGRLIYVDPTGSSIGRGAVSYWSYETFLKKHESRACSLIGASGCLYAVRRSAYLPLYPEAHGDFIIATKMVQQGLRTVFEPDAVCTEETNRRIDHELNMRVRVITQTFTDLWRHRAMLNPFRSGFFAIQLISHKVLRYSVPFFMLALFIGSAILASSSLIYLSLLVAQIGFYLATALAWVLDRMGVGSRLLAFPQYFVIVNAASVLALFKLIRGERFARWEPIRESAEATRATPASMQAGLAETGRGES
jgi:cellulose synthase/poly-beta-1,6-N-acetylglucosamine synthase-like glycosyltransferase